MRSCVHTLLYPWGIHETSSCPDWGDRAVTTAGGTRTGTGLSLGTPQYMNPEQATGEREVTADVYSLGAVVYEMSARKVRWLCMTSQQKHGKLMM